MRSTSARRTCRRPTIRTRTSGSSSPENSRRARALAVWATLRAYGRAGYREMVERHVTLARHLADRVDASPELERLADVPLNIVCFRAHPPGLGEERLNELNTRLGDALRADGRVFVGIDHLRREDRAATSDRQLADRHTATSTSWSTSRASSPPRYERRTPLASPTRRRQLRAERKAGALPL